MAFILDAVTLKRPQAIRESNSTQVAQHRTLSGAVSRDYFGSNKRVWELSYRNILKTDFDTINAIYQSYLADGEPVSFESTEGNYTISATTVHVDIPDRGFSVGGADYISDFRVTLTES